MKYYPRLKDLREDRDLKQKEIAPILHTSQRQYSRWETGESEIPFGLAIVLARYYNVSLDYIAGLTNDPQGGVQQWKGK
ncbi:MAG TPA: helix-turn-helix transcriptional regulator [Candidatus Faecousia intestinigallinarum]|nr:helix-turn-helix transcriptional regulator [Candidatus Faecousia intestinigallinarum]